MGGLEKLSDRPALRNRLMDLHRRELLRHGPSATARALDASASDSVPYSASMGPARSPRRAGSPRRGLPAGRVAPSGLVETELDELTRRDATDRCRGPPGRVA